MATQAMIDQKHKFEMKNKQRRSSVILCGSGWLNYQTIYIRPIQIQSSIKTLEARYIHNLVSKF